LVAVLFLAQILQMTDAVDHMHGPVSLLGQHCWPKNLGYQYQTYARPGSGNLQILERMLSQVNNPDPVAFVIGWSFIDRFDYLRKDPEKWPGAPWATVLPLDKNELTDCYFRHFHSQLKDKLCSLLYVKTAIDILKQKNIPFIMTYVDELMFETNWHTNSAIAELQEYVKPYMTSFDGYTFLEFAKHQGFPVSNTGHPLESAHYAAFELMKSYNLL
jgi:hypothetical protein